MPVTLMKIRNLIVLLLTLVVPLMQSRNGTGWRGIVPLRSTRTEVEQELGSLDPRCLCYKTEKELVGVVYATGPCTGELPGWNVPRDTVLSLTITPYKEVPFSEIEPRKEDFVRTVDDTFTAYYGNGDKGLRYSVSATGFITNISYLPSVKDNSRRCVGFPLTDGGITAYSPYDDFTYDSLEDITSRLGEFAIRLQKQRGYKGYIVVYADRNQKTDGVASFANKARDYLIKELKTDPDTIVSVNGGYREQSIVQLFLIPSSWPPPVANPTLPGTLK